MLKIYLMLLGNIEEKKKICSWEMLANELNKQKILENFV